MARTAVRRVNSRTDRNKYISVPESDVRKRAVAKRDVLNRKKASYAGTAVSSRTLRNRQRALSLSRGYVVFLVLICAATVFMCVNYLRLKATITTQQSNNETLASELSSMKAENDALYDSVMGSLDLESIKETAINQYGMHYATQDQIIWYNADNSGYARQYQKVPSD